MDKLGLVHIYYGDGQGKTSAAIGLALRASGSGGKVLYTQFLKNGRSSELKALRLLSDGIEVLLPEPCMKFVFQMTEQERQMAAEEQTACFHQVVQKVSTGTYRLLVMDEIIDAAMLGMVDRAEFFRFLEDKPKELEVAITGHGMLEGLLEMADYISEIKKVKHPYDRGVMARIGIDM